MTVAPALPALGVMQLWLHVGWALVLAALGAALMAACTPRVLWRRVVAGVLVAWALIPGPLSAAYWLGLAFQAPSAAAVVVCGAWVWRLMQGSRSNTLARAPSADWWWVLGGVLLGWVLLLDSFAQWPVALYRWGFDRPALGALVLVAVLPLLQKGAVQRLQSWLLLLALALFVLLRLPTGNVWDAVLDPWLWVGLHGALWMGVRQRMRKT